MNQKSNSHQIKVNRLDLIVGLPPLQLNEIYNDDSFKLIERVPDKTVDLILEDMPYNTTACDWDVKIDLELYWETRLRILKPTGVICLTASEPFTSELLLSNKKLFRYDLVWEKSMPSDIFRAKYKPLKYHENILIFASGGYTFNPILQERSDVGKARLRRNGKVKMGTGKSNVTNYQHSGIKIQYDENKINPKSVIKIKSVPNCNGTKLHSSQKPVGLFEYLIRTYTNEDDLVFDGFGGSGTTAIAAHKSKRNFIVIEKEQKYYELSKKRLDNERAQLTLL